MTLTYIALSIFVIIVGALTLYPHFRKKHELFILIKKNYIINKFIYFLFLNDIYDLYINNLKRNKKPYNLYDLCFYTKEAYYVSQSFIWYDTKEGFDFWENINNMWIRNKHKYVFITSKDLIKFIKNKRKI